MDGHPIRSKGESEEVGARVGWRVAFVFTSVAFAGETARWMEDHSDLYAANPEWENSVVKNNDRDQSFRDGDRELEFDRGVWGYYRPEEDAGVPSKLQVAIQRKAERPVEKRFFNFGKRCGKP